MQLHGDATFHALSNPNEASSHLQGYSNVTAQYLVFAGLLQLHAPLPPCPGRALLWHH